MTHPPGRVAAISLVGALVGIGAIVATAAPAGAHGVGGRIDLPLPAWQLAWAAGFAVASSFVAVGLFWGTPRLAAATPGVVLGPAWQRASRWLVWLGRPLTLAALAVVVFAALWGNVNGATNIAPVAVYITFWVGMQLVSMVVGDVWRDVSPLNAIADGAARIRARVRGEPLSSVEHGAGNRWPAVVAVASFLWLELGLHNGSRPRAIGVWLVVYCVVLLAGAARWGRGWVRDADGFAVLFALLAAMAPLWRDPQGQMRARVPLAGLAAVAMVPGTVPFVLVVLGSTSFDGFRRSSMWLEVASGRAGWELTLVNSVGLLFATAVVSLAYLGAIRVMARITDSSENDLAAAFGASLVPIAAAYAIAHYFSYLVLEGQNLITHASDPFGRGWDLFSTVDYEPNLLLVSTTAIAWIQTVAIALGHVFAVALAHDRAIERFDHSTAVRSQYPMLAVMVLYTVAGLFLLLGA